MWDFLKKFDTLEEDNYLEEGISRLDSTMGKMGREESKENRSLRIGLRSWLTLTLYIWIAISGNACADKSSTGRFEERGKSAILLFTNYSICSTLFSPKQTHIGQTRGGWQKIMHKSDYIHGCLAVKTFLVLKCSYTLL